MWFLHMRCMIIVHHSITLMIAGVAAGISRQCVVISIDKGVHEWATTAYTDKPPSIRTLHRSPKHLDNNTVNHPTNDNRQVQIEMHTIKGRQAAKLQLVRQQTAEVSTETTKHSIGASMELVLFLLAGFLAMTEGQSELMRIMTAICQSLCLSLPSSCHLSAKCRHHDSKSYVNPVFYPPL